MKKNIFRTKLIALLCFTAICAVSMTMYFFKGNEDKEYAFADTIESGVEILSFTMDTGASPNVDEGFRLNNTHSAIEAGHRTISMDAQNIARILNSGEFVFANSSDFVFKAPTDAQKAYYSVFQAGSSLDGRVVNQVSTAIMDVSISTEVNPQDNILRLTVKKMTEKAVSVYVGIGFSENSTQKEIVVRFNISIQNTLSYLSSLASISEASADTLVPRTDPFGGSTSGAPFRNSVSDKDMVCLNMDTLEGRRVSPLGDMLTMADIPDTSGYSFVLFEPSQANYFDLTASNISTNGRLLYIKFNIRNFNVTEGVSYVDTHMDVTLRDTSSKTVKYRLYFRISFADSISMKTSFDKIAFNYSNAGETNFTGINLPEKSVFHLENGKYYFKVSAEDIFDYAGGILFDDTYDIVKNGNLLSEILFFNDDPNAVTQKTSLLLYPSSNGVGTIEVAVKKKTGAGTASTKFLLQVKVIGVYAEKAITISNRKWFDLKSSDFEPYKDNFTLVQVAGRHYVNQVIDGLNMDITYSETTKTLSFRAINRVQQDMTIYMQDNYGNIVKQKLVINLNPDAENFYAQLSPVQKILFIIALSVAALLIILGIIALMLRHNRKKMQEIEEAKAPTSSYLVKLNTAIASQQAQMRTAPALAPPPEASSSFAQLAAPQSAKQPEVALLAAPESAPAPQSSVIMPSAPVIDPIVQPVEVKKEELPKLPLTDDELIERIYVEKYEPKGMSKRSFYMSKDLQMRELEKEKERIYAEIKSGRSVEEACRPSFDIGSLAKSLIRDNQPSASATSGIANVSPEEAELMKMLGEEVPDIKLQQSENAIADLEALIADLTDKLAVATVQNENLNDEYIRLMDEQERLREDIATRETDIENTRLKLDQAQYELADLEIKANSGKTRKERDDAAVALVKKEEYIRENRPLLEKKVSELENKKRGISIIDTKISKNKGDMATMKDTVDTLKVRLDESKVKLSELQGIRAKEQEKQQTQSILAAQAEALDKKRTQFKELALTANKMDYELFNINKNIDMLKMKKKALQVHVEENQDKLVNTNDINEITRLSTEVSNMNVQIAEMDKMIFETTKQRTQQSVQLSTSIKQANEFASANDIKLDEIISLEDSAIIEYLKHENLAKAAQEFADSETALQEAQEANTQAIFDADELLKNVAKRGIEISNQAEAALNALKEEIELNKVAQTMVSDDDEKNALLMQEIELGDKLSEAEEALEKAKSDTIKNNINAKNEAERIRHDAKKALSDAQKRYEEAAEVSTIIATTGEAPVKYIEGSGVIANDRKQAELAALRKKLDQTVVEKDRQRIMAKIAEYEADKALFESERVTSENRANIERLLVAAVERMANAGKDGSARLSLLEEAARLKIAAYEEEARIKAAEREKEMAEQREREEALLKEEQRIKEEAQKREEERKKLEAEMKEEAKKKEEELEKERARLQDEAARLQTLEATQKFEFEKMKAEEELKKLREMADLEKQSIMSQLEKEKMIAMEKDKALSETEQRRIASLIEAKRREFSHIRSEIIHIRNEEDGKRLYERMDRAEFTMEPEQKTPELYSLAERIRAEIKREIEFAIVNKKPEKPVAANDRPRTILKKVTEKVNFIPRSQMGGGEGQAQGATSGARAGGARAGGARPAGARPAGARPAGAGARAGGARPAGARPAGAGARPAGARPAGAGARPAGARPARPAGERPARSSGARPAPRPRPSSGDGDAPQ